MAAALDRALGFVATGTRLCAEAIAGLDEDALDVPTPLPGWSRRHVVAHLAANAEALGRLVHWAATGEVTPMYASPRQRNEQIEAGVRRDDLAEWFALSAATLDEGFASMPAAGWHAEVRTAQGRTVRAREVPWMRSREVLVHAVDLGTGVTFAHLPEPFLSELRAEILAKRAAEGVPPLVGDLPSVTAYLAGRRSTGVTTVDGRPVPELSPWL